MDYKSNSNKSKTENEKKVEKVTSGTVQKESFIKNFIKDDLSTISHYILTDVVIPSIRTAIYDTLTGGIDALFYGGESKQTNTASRVSYHSKYNSSTNYNSNKTKQHIHPDTVIIDTRAEAENVLLRMQELISAYGIVSIADFYELVDLSCQYTDYKYGWTNIDGASVVRDGTGYVIKLPKTKPLN